MSEKTLFDDFIGETFSKISHENLSLFSFIWTLYIARLSTGGDVDNFYSLEMGNKWYTVDLKVTIKEKMTIEEMKKMKEIYGFDFEKAIKEFKDAGIINGDV
ncbi:MAG: hypothetical protein K6A34_06235 [Methanobrevibacter sp.]|nr:hypothetical protein [Methanobrevibacter sp.]